jgi:hypothetical protein
MKPLGPQAFRADQSDERRKAGVYARSVSWASPRVAKAFIASSRSVNTTSPAAVISYGRRRSSSGSART